jgi:hypothetical protein
MILITSKVHDGLVWHVDCKLQLPDGTRSGTEVVSLPDTATDEEITVAVLAAYSVVP